MAAAEPKKFKIDLTGKYVAETFEEFKRVMRAHELNTDFRYVNCFGVPKFNGSEIILHAKKKMHWVGGIPYFHLGSRTYLCHLGKDRNTTNKAKYKRLKEEQAGEPITIKQYNRQIVSKKLDCPASINVMRMYQMPQFKLRYGLTRSRKTRQSAAIRHLIARGEHVPGEDRYVFNLPTPEEHKHDTPLQNEMTSELIDDHVKNYISALVYQGHRELQEVHTLLNKFVREGLKKVDMTHRRWYPTQKTIKKIIDRTVQKIEESGEELEEVAIIVVP